MDLLQTARSLRAALATPLAAALIVLSPGLAPYEAAAQVVGGAASSAASRGPAANIVPISKIGTSGIPAVGAFTPALSSSFGVPSTRTGWTAAPAALALDAAFILPAPLADETAPVAAQETPPTAAAGNAGPGVLGKLALIAPDLNAARSEVSKGEALSTLFTGMRRRLDLDESSIGRTASHQSPRFVPPCLRANSELTTTADHAPSAVPESAGGAKGSGMIGVKEGFRALRPAAAAAIVVAAIGAAAASIPASGLSHPAMLTISKESANLLLAFAMAPIAEEVFFRGALLGGLMWLGSRAGLKGFALFIGPALINSVAFGAAHWQAYDGSIALMINAGLMGIVWSVLRFRAGLMASVAMHSLTNLLTGCMGMIFEPFALLGAAVWLAGEADGWNGENKLKGWSDFWSSTKGRVGRTTAAILVSLLIPLLALDWAYMDLRDWRDLTMFLMAPGLAAYVALKALIGRGEGPKVRRA